MGAIHIDFVSTLVEPTDERMSYRLVLVISGLEIFLGQTKYLEIITQITLVGEKRASGVLGDKLFL